MKEARVERAVPPVTTQLKPCNLYPRYIVSFGFRSNLCICTYVNLCVLTSRVTVGAFATHCVTTGKRECYQREVVMARLAVRNRLPTMHRVPTHNPFIITQQRFLCTSTYNKQEFVLCIINDKSWGSFI